MLGKYLIKDVKIGEEEFKIGTELNETIIEKFILTNLVIVILVCLLILFYNSNSANKILFENKILIFIGNISFSLYL